MSIILNIDCSVETAVVNLSENGICLGLRFNAEQKDHAGFLQSAILELSHSTGISLKKLDAIAVCYGPGSYTGLRVGMASAKGLCYALQKPLITLNTLETLADLAIRQYQVRKKMEDLLFCPMIDARRMEVFTAIYDEQLNSILPGQAMVIDNDSFEDFLQKNRILFFGNGAQKWKNICTSPQAEFFQLDINPLFMSLLSNEKFLKSDFADVAYSEPLYLKEFHFPGQ